MSELPRPEDKMRHTVSMTHKQLGISGGILASVIAVTQLKSVFTPIETTVAQGTQIRQILDSQTVMKNEIIARIERGNDKLMERMKEAESRNVRDADRNEKRIDNLELYAFKMSPKVIK